MKILGIDQSYNGCAWVIVEAGSMIDFGIIRTDKNKDNYARALSAALQLHEIYTKYSPNAVQLEGLAFGMMGNVTRELAGLLFTIINILVLKNPNIVYKVLPPTSVKKYATGSGKAKKADMITALPSAIRDQFVAKNFKKTTGMADLADAYWIGLFE